MSHVIAIMDRAYPDARERISRMLPPPPREVFERSYERFIPNGRIRDGTLKKVDVLISDLRREGDNVPLPRSSTPETPTANVYRRRSGLLGFVDRYLK